MTRHGRGVLGSEPASRECNDEVMRSMPEPVAEFYRGYLSHDVPRMLAVFAHHVRVNFPSYPVLAGIEQAAAYFEFQETVFHDLVFELVNVYVDGPVSAVVWREQGHSSSGQRWTSHGVDVFRHAHGLIRSLDVGGHFKPLRDALGRFPGFV